MRMQYKTIGEICTVVSGTTPKSDKAEYWGGNLIWITPAELKEGNAVIYDSVRHITKAAVKASALKPFPKGTVILSSRAPIGKVAIAGTQMYCNQGFKNLICSEVIYNGYLYYYLKAKTAYLNSLGRGATFREISKQIVEKIKIPVPSMQEQHRIADILFKIDALMGKRQQQAEKLDELVKARFVEMFGDPVRNTKQFPLVELQDLYDVSSSKRVYQDEMVLDGIPFLRISDIVEKSTNDKCTPQCFISQEMYDQLSQKGLTPNVGDILVTSRGTLGLCYEVKPGEKFYFQDGMISWLYNRKDCVINTYLLYAFRLPGIRKQIDGSNDGSTVSYLSIARLKRLKIELPPLALQTEFSHFVHEVDRETERIQRSAALLETLKRSLMQQYFG